MNDFICEPDIFDVSKLYNTFLNDIYEVVFELSKETAYLAEKNLLPLVLEYKPCKDCMLVTNVKPIPVRCHCHHDVSRGCSNFTTPCLTWSKIGVVLHLGYVMKDKSIHYLDIDISVPNF